MQNETDICSWLFISLLTKTKYSITYYNQLFNEKYSLNSIVCIFTDMKRNFENKVSNMKNVHQTFFVNRMKTIQKNGKSSNKCLV